MKLNLDAFNVELLNLSPAQLRHLKRVEVVDIYDNPTTHDFHEDGLFSTEIFGHVGDPERSKTFAYLALGSDILHPAIYLRLVKLKAIYSEIMSGKAYAVFDQETKDFLPSNELDGDTGYSFFLEHWKDIDYGASDSEIREERVTVIKAESHRAHIENVIVMPAGHRDATVDNFGRTQEDEVNALYRNIISIARTISKEGNRSKINDRARHSLQMKFNVIHVHILSLLKGKTGYGQTKLMGRNTLNGVRTVLTAQAINEEDLDNDHGFGPQDTGMGLYHCSRGALPITQVQLKHFVSDNFGEIDVGAVVVDAKTLKKKTAQLKSGEFDRWTTPEGLEKVISSQSNKERLARPVMIGKDYLALVYRPEDEDVFKVFHDISELPAGRSEEDVHPITLIELIYLCNYAGWNDLKTLVTRYPVTGEASTYPSNVHVLTTTDSKVRVELDDDWNVQPLTKENTALVYPKIIPNEYAATLDAGYLHSSRLGGLQADFDGDQVNMPILYTAESIDEINHHFTLRRSVVNSDGQMRAPMGTDTLAFSMYTMTRLNEDG